MKKLLYSMVLFILTIIAAGAASAAVLWDWSPQKYGDISDEKGWHNMAVGQNFAEQIKFSTDITLTGMDIWQSNVFTTTKDDDVRVKIWNDTGGAPGTPAHSFLNQITGLFTETIGTGVDSFDIKRVHVSFDTPLTLLADTYYWIGMSGTKTDLLNLGLMSFATGSPADPRPAPGDSQMALFRENAYSSLEKVGDMAFRLYGNTNSPVPEPTAMILFGMGLLGLTGAGRKKR